LSGHFRDLNQVKGSTPMRAPNIARTWWLAWAFLASGLALAEDAIVGSVLAVRGDVSVESDGSLQPLRPNGPVRSGDAIVSDRGKARIALDDGCVISVGEHSRVWIRHYEANAGNVKGRLTLVSGAMRLLVAKVSRDGNFEVESETAVAAVRGTEWVMEATPEQTSVAVVSGSVAVSARGHPEAIVVLQSPREGTDVRRNSAPTPPATWDARRLADVLARATFD
jgi:hypothetical protein